MKAAGLMSGTATPFVLGMGITIGFLPSNATRRDFEMAYKSFGRRCVGTLGATAKNRDPSQEFLHKLLLGGRHGSI